MLTVMFSLLVAVMLACGCWSLYWGERLRGTFAARRIELDRSREANDRRCAMMRDGIGSWCEWRLLDAAMQPITYGDAGVPACTVFTDALQLCVRAAITLPYAAQPAYFVVDVSQLGLSFFYPTHCQHLPAEATMEIEACFSIPTASTATRGGDTETTRLLVAPYGSVPQLRGDNV